MKLSIVVLTPGAVEGKVIPINGPQFFIGRDPACQLRPTSNHISKRHFALLQRQDKVFVRDFDSTNGTFVNDRQIKGEIELLDGDRLRVGPLTFVVKLEKTPVDMQTPMPPAMATTQKETAAPASSPPTNQPASSTDNEDEAAATLLAMQDSDAPDAGPREEVPEGSTVHDLPIPILAEKEKEQAKKPSGDTSASAKSILDKYLKRPRPG